MPAETTSPDGWEVSVGAKVWGDKKPLDDSEIPEVCRGTIIDWIYTDFGLVIISSDKYVGFIKDGKLVKTWDTEVSPDNFLFDASLFNEHAKYRYYGYVGNSMVRILDELVEYETLSLAQYEFTGINWYSYYILSDNLYFWSPSCNALVDTMVVESNKKRRIPRL